MNLLYLILRGHNLKDKKHVKAVRIILQVSANVLLPTFGGRQHKQADFFQTGLRGETKFHEDAYPGGATACRVVELEKRHCQALQALFLKLPGMDEDCGQPTRC